MNNNAVLWLDEDIPLLEVSLCPGWEIAYHQLYDVQPDRPVYVGNCPGGDYSELFKATLLVLHCAEHDDLIDLGWTPEADLSGAFRIALYRDSDRDAPVQECSSRDPNHAVSIAMNFMSLRR